jgi:hypothetical protein
MESVDSPLSVGGEGGGPDPALALALALISDPDLA